jgi:hypothetical protein
MEMQLHRGWMLAIVTARSETFVNSNSKGVDSPTNASPMSIFALLNSSSTGRWAR